MSNNSRASDCVCRHCKGTSRDPLRRCGQCKVVRYCSTACQRAHWKAGHKEHCQPCLGDGGPGSVLFDAERQRIVLIGDDGSRTTIHSKTEKEYADMMQEQNWDEHRPENAKRKRETSI